MNTLNNEQWAKQKQDPGDLNGDGEVTSEDVDLILSSFGCTTCDAFDFNNDGVVNVGDVLVYIDLIDG